MCFCCNESYEKRVLLQCNLRMKIFDAFFALVLLLKSNFIEGKVLGMYGLALSQMVEETDQEHVICHIPSTFHN